MNFTTLSACGGSRIVKGPGVIGPPQTAVVSELSNCSWTLISLSTSILLEVSAVDIEKSADCSKDKLIVRVDGQESKLCDLTVNSPTSKLAGSRIEIEFAVDAAVTRERGFNISYSGETSPMFDICLQ